MTWYASMFGSVAVCYGPISVNDNSPVHPENDLANNSANAHHDANEISGLQAPAIIAQKD